MKYLLSAALLAAIAIPATAQMRGDMREPTMKQCRMGYRTSYMRTMDWSRQAFRQACDHKMMMMKKNSM